MVWSSEPQTLHIETNLNRPPIIWMRNSVMSTSRVVTNGTIALIGSWLMQIDDGIEFRAWVPAD